MARAVTEHQPEAMYGDRILMQIVGAPRTLGLARFGFLDSVRVVAKKGGINDWAAYCGAASESADAIAAHGDKLMRDEAAPLFPLLVATRYRP